MLRALNANVSLDSTLIPRTRARFALSVEIASKAPRTNRSRYCWATGDHRTIQLKFKNAWYNLPVWVELIAVDVQYHAVQLCLCQ